jgi:hypothetical protein
LHKWEEAYSVVSFLFSPLLRDGRPLSPPLLADLPSFANVVFFILPVLVLVLLVLLLLLVFLFVLL